MYQLSKGQSTVYDCRDNDDMLPWSRDGALRALQSRDPACLVSENMLERFADVMTEPETGVHTRARSAAGVYARKKKKGDSSNLQWNSCCRSRVSALSSQGVPHPCKANMVKFYLARENTSLA